MAIISIQVRLPWNTGDVRGAVSTNTWHFDTGSVTPTDSNTNTIAETIVGTYTSAIAPFLSSVFTGDVTASVYNLDDPKPRLPIHVETGTFTPGADTLPGECSLKLGIQAARETGVHVQRRRGTLQLGPLAKSLVGDDGRLTPDAMDDLASLAQNLSTGLNGATEYVWVVGTEAFDFRPVNRILITNELGTVRRRQLPYTDRRVVAV